MCPAVQLQSLGRQRANGSEPILTIEECQALCQEVLEHWAAELLNGL